MRKIARAAVLRGGGCDGGESVVRSDSAHIPTSLQVPRFTVRWLQGIGDLNALRALGIPKYIDSYSAFDVSGLRVADESLAECNCPR